MGKAELSEIRANVEAFFHAKLYEKACIKRYNHTWDHLMDYMTEKNISSYEPSVGKSFLLQRHGTDVFEDLTHRQQEVVRHIEVLGSMLLEGKVLKSRHINRVIDFEGELGVPFKDFIVEYTPLRSLPTMARYKERILNFYQFLAENQLTIAKFSTRDGVKYLSKLDKQKSACDRDNIVMTTRVFLRYLCSKKLLPVNREEEWLNLFRIKNVKNKKIPSVYTKEEVENIISVIDRNNPQGKRDYAMVLLAARYGLRISDIIGLRFCNLDWEQNRISIIQKKTAKKVLLPLSEEVGCAIIEYIKYGRPTIDSPFVFITAHAPYKELGSNTLCSCISEYMRIAGINTTGKKKGPHALRHSLATNLLKCNEPIPIISEILGHSTTESTTTYLRVDYDLLRRCALDVPLVPTSFYGNLYG